MPHDPKSISGAIIFSWSHIVKLLGWLIPVLLAIVMLYLRSEFVTHKQVEEAIHPIKDLPARVHTIENFTIRHEQLSSETVKNTMGIQQDISTMKAQITGLKEQSTKDTDRILNRLDIMQKDR